MNLERIKDLTGIAQNLLISLAVVLGGASARRPMTTSCLCSRRRGRPLLCQFLAPLAQSEFTTDKVIPPDAKNWWGGTRLEVKKRDTTPSPQ